MLKKLVAGVIGTAFLVVPIATAGSAAAAPPVYQHVIEVIGHQHVFWDRNWPSANREIDKNYDDVRIFKSNSAGTGVTPRFNTTTSFGGLNDLDGVREEATLSVKEIPNSGGRVSVTFENWLAYGGSCGGCWSNRTTGAFQLNAGGKGHYTLINKRGDGSWGQTDIVITNHVS